MALSALPRTSPVAIASQYNSSSRKLSQVLATNLPVAHKLLSSQFTAPNAASCLKLMKSSQFVVESPLGHVICRSSSSLQNAPAGLLTFFQLLASNNCLVHAQNIFVPLPSLTLRCLMGQCRRPKLMLHIQLNHVQNGTQICSVILPCNLRKLSAERQFLRGVEPCGLTPPHSSW